jgi:hypothetical protein
MASDSPYTVSPTDRSGLIVIVETLFMSWMIIVGLIRFYMRLAINGPVQIDDLMVFVGSVSLLQTILHLRIFHVSPGPSFYDEGVQGLIFPLHHIGTSCRSCRNNHGRSEPRPRPTSRCEFGIELKTCWRGKSVPSSIRCNGGCINSPVFQSLYAANLLFLAAHGASKISVCLLLKRLGRQQKYLLASGILLGMVVAWTIASFLAIALSCYPEYLLDQSAVAQKCGNLVCDHLLSLYDPAHN